MTLTRTLSQAIALASALGLSLGVTASNGAAQKQTAPAAAAQNSTTQKQAAPAPAAQNDASSKSAAGGKVDPDAVEALKEMSTYLGTLRSFEVTANVTQDLVTAEGQRVQLGQVAQYKVRRPNGFQIDLTTDFRKRRFYFDGKQFTVFAPELGFYATTEAPPTIRETIDLVEKKLGIDLPLDDLFRWNDPDNNREQQLTSGFEVGPATVDGVATDHYAFREGNHDWEVWIQQGERALPRKLVIVDRSDEAHPTYVARLSWKINPAIASNEFTFKPGPNAKAIQFGVVGQ